MNGIALYRQARKILVDIENGDFEARQLFLFCCGEYPIDLRETDCSTFEEKLLELCRRRVNREPLQYILGTAPFLDFELEVGPGVLIPRQDTECVVLQALRLLEGIKSPVIIDLCAGSGCIGIAISRSIPDAKVICVERYEEALYWLKRNAKKLTPYLEIVSGDVFDYLPSLQEKGVDLIISNPPYVTEEEYRDLEPELYREPKTALVANSEGLAFYRDLIPGCKPVLREGGTLLFEIGETQKDTVINLFRENGASQIGCGVDDSGRDRYVYGRFS